MNLPNALTGARIAVTPLIAILPFSQSSSARLTAFALFVAAAVSDYADGVLARSRKQETNLGKLLDPLADKLLLVGTFIPMYVLMRQGVGAIPLVPDFAGRVDPLPIALPFRTPWGDVGLPWWIGAIVLGRELLMTIFRQIAHRRGVVIAAIGPAKWKTAIQLIWQGVAYFWFFAATLASERAWQSDPAWNGAALFIGTVGSLAMTVAVLLTLYSLWLYLSRYGGVFVHSGARG